MKLSNLSKIALTAIALTITSPADTFDITQDPFGYCLNETKQAQALKDVMNTIDRTLIEHAKASIVIRGYTQATMDDENKMTVIRAALKKLGDTAYELSSNSSISCTNEFKGKYYGLISSAAKKARLAKDTAIWEDDTWKAEDLTKMEKAELKKANKESDLHPGSEMSEMADRLDQEVREEDCEKIDMAARASKE